MFLHDAIYLGNLINFIFVLINLIQQRQKPTDNMLRILHTKKTKKVILNQIFLPAGEKIRKNLNRRIKN